MTFQLPHMFWLLALLPLLAAVKWLADVRGRKLLEKAVTEKIRPAWVDTRSGWREWTSLGLELAALMLFITALARPQFGYTEEEVTSSGRSLMLAIDTSRSMLAEDIKPNRLERTKLIANELIKKLPGDKIGLIAFAGKAFLQAPITLDHGALSETLDQFDTDLIPRGGSNLSEAIDLAVEAFTGYRPDGSLDEKVAKSAATVRQNSQALLIFSDGEELEGEVIEAANRAANRGVMIISVGVGTAEGGVIPFQPTSQDIFGRPVKGAPDYVKDEAGKIVRTQLVEKNLVAVANATRGLYVPLLNLIKDERLPLIMKKLEVGESQSKTIRKPLERYQIPLGFAIVFLLGSLGVRTLPRLLSAFQARGGLTNAALILLLAILSGPAAAWGAEETAVKLKHNPETYRRVLGKFQQKLGSSVGDHPGWNWLGEGAVEFAKGNYDQAVAAYGQALSTGEPELSSQAHFGLANTIYRQAAEFAKELTAPKKTDAAVVKTSETPEKPAGPTKEDLEKLISKLQDSLTHYTSTLAHNAEHKPAKENKKIVEDLLKNLEAQKEQMEQQEKDKEKEKEKDKQSGDGEGKDSDKKEQDKKEGEKDGKGESKGKDGKGESKEGESKEKGEKKPGDKGQGEGEGTKDGKGDKSQEGKDGAGTGKEKDKDKDGEKADLRSEEQKKKDADAKEKSNQEREGQIQAESDNKGKKGTSKKPGEPQPTTEESDNTKDKNGFSPAMARRQAAHMADEAKVRQEIQERKERVFKNW